MYDEVEWEYLEDVLEDFGSVDKLDYKTKDLIENPRIGVICEEPETLDSFLKTIESSIKSRNGAVVYFDFRNVKTSEDVQKLIIDTIKEYFPDRCPESEEANLSFIATEYLSAMERISKDFQRNLCLIVDFRGMEITPSILRPGGMFWWVYNLMSKCVNSSFIWIIDSEEKADQLINHGQMKRIFSPELTNFYLIV
jgi:hypothetical protein